MKVKYIMPVLAMGVVCAANPGVRVELASTRCIYSSPHDESGKRIELRIEVSPSEEGWHVNEGGSRGKVITGMDPAGNEYKSAPCSWEKTPGKEGSRTACFVFSLKNKVERLVIREQIQVRLAHELRTFSDLEVDLLQPNQVTLPGSELPLTCKPDPSNAEEANRENDGTLHSAGLTLICPPGHSILRVGRVWRSDQEEEGKDSSYTQDLEVRNRKDADGNEVAHVTILAAQEKECLEIETCGEQSSVRVPLHLRAMLGDPAPSVPQAAAKP